MSALGHLWRKLWNDPPPALACEFAADAVAAARWSPGAVKPEQFALRPLAEGLLKPSPLRENLGDRDAVKAALAAALDDVTRDAPRRRQIAVLLPDLSARVNVLQFDETPSKAEEMLALIRFRLKKSVPFDVDTAAVSYQMQGNEVLTAVSPQVVVRQYESLLEDLGYEPGFVTVSTLAGLSLVTPLSSATAGAMLLRHDGHLMTIAVTSGGRLRMLRVTEAGGAPAANQEDLFREIFSSAIFYQDNYGGRIERILESGLGPEAEPLWRQVESELGTRPKPLAVPGAFGAQGRFLGIFGVLTAQASA
jgi:type IV pilus assembly protein PilM